MAVKHKLKCFDSEILVVSENDADSFQVNIQSTANPLGFGNTIDTYDTEQKAIEAAAHFCQAYTIAREKGYYLEDKHFTKGGKEERIPVNEIIHSKRSVQQFVSNLQE
jgi:hypothetical protein